MSVKVEQVLACTSKSDRGVKFSMIIWGHKICSVKFGMVAISEGEIAILDRDRDIERETSEAWWALRAKPILKIFLHV